MNTNRSLAATAPDAPVAVVVGLCAHGLAIVRALSKNGVRVHALEARPERPGVQTRHALVHIVSDVNGVELIPELLRVRAELGVDRNPVLLLTNDRMVSVVCKMWEQLDGAYELSWARERATIAKLLDKSTLEKRCDEVGLNYPRSSVLRDLARIDELTHLKVPLIVKPSKPLGRFKALLVSTFDELVAIGQRYANELPLLVQEWVPGGDSALTFSALYLKDGRTLAHCEGRKLLSNPPALGQTVIAEPIVEERVYELTQRFFDGLNLSGPVSLELKRGPDDNFYVIEPTIGRTDYWLPMCIANGVDFPHLEYCDAAGLDLPTAVQSGGRRWYDTETDPLCFLRTVRALEIPSAYTKAVFPYFDAYDLRPFLRSVAHRVAGVWGRLKSSRRVQTVPDQHSS